MSATAPDISLAFTLNAPLLKAQEESVRGEKIRFVSGMASQEVPDQQGETVIQKGIDFGPMLAGGFINWDHNDVRKGDPGALIGYPLTADVRPYQGVDGLYFEGRLFDPGHPTADAAWHFLIAVGKSNGARRAGWSIQGRTIAAANGKLLRTVLTDMALTHKPVLKESTVDFREICKSLHADGYLDPAMIAKAATIATLTPVMREDLLHGNPPNKRETLAKGEASMPRDVEAEWDRQAGAAEVQTDGDWSLYRNTNGFFAQSPDGSTWFAGDRYGAPLRNFATVLDAVAERRVAERMRGQAPAPAVTSAQPEPRRFSDVRPDRHGWRWWRQTGRDSTDLGQRFETQDGRCRWRSAHAEAWFAPDTANPQMLRYTVIPTDEQGNPVSWDSIGQTRTSFTNTPPPTETQRQALAAQIAEWSGTPEPAGTVQSVNSDGTVTVRLNGDGSVSPAREGEAGAIRARWAAPEGFYMSVPSTSFFSAEPPNPPRPGQFSNNPATPPLTPEGLLAVMQNYAVPGIHVTVGTGAKPAQTEAITTWPLPLPRFTADELDDVDHSKTTKLDEVTLRRGKLPTVEQIAKYREVRARRTGGTVADALKESRIDCEVAQYVLERWAGGLGDADTVLLLHRCCDVPAEVGCCPPPFDPKQGEVDQRSQDFLRTHNAALDTSEKPSPTVQRERQEAEERRQRLAALRQRLAAERAAQLQETAKESAASRFDLIEPDPQADPAASIRAWEARQAAAKVRPAAVPPRIAKPAATPRRPAIEVVDAEVDGLSRSEAFAALFGRALNGGC
jgi:hypothetical protein